jgi:hypothetical protein
MTKDEFTVKVPSIAEHSNEYFNAENNGYIFQSINELLDFIACFNTTGCFFRGQSGLWSITSSLHRHYGTPRFEKACNIAFAAVDWIKQNKYISNAIGNNEDYALAIAQHYGCPTDLVDVTTNLRTAAYFATGKTSEPLGCLWIFTERDIEELRDIISSDFFGCFSGLNENMKSKLVQNNYSQLMKIDVPLLSRLNAQDGAFLWDVAGLLKQQLTWRVIGTRFVFKHNCDERRSFTEEDVKLFPFPNQLESEIMRIFTETGHADGLPEYTGFIDVSILEREGVLKRGLPAQIVDKAKGTAYFPLPDYFTPSFGEYAWTHRTITSSSMTKKKTNMAKCIECYLPLDVTGVLELVDHILKSVAAENLTDLLIIFYEHDKDNNRTLYSVHDGDEEVLVDIVLTLNNYLYSKEEIAKVVLEWIKIMIFKEINGFNTISADVAIIDGYVSGWLRKYYKCRIEKLRIYDEMGFTRFWLPEKYEFLDVIGQNEFNAFDMSCYSPPKMLESYFLELADNAKIFIYQHKPQKILPYENLKNMFIDLILPQHFAFRRVSDRIYIPDYVVKMCLTVFGSKVFLDKDISEYNKVGGIVIL